MTHNYLIDMSERLEDIIAGRRRKLEEIKSAGIDPYPSVAARTHTNKQAVDDFDSIGAQKITLVGRVRSWRDMGKLIFAHIEDGSGKIQVLFKSDDLGADNFKFALKHFDIGDFLEISGTLFKTKSGEKTLQAASYKLLSKSLRPLPSEHFGLSDEETKLRKRYLDILMNPEVKDMFVKKHTFWQSSRKYLYEKGFIEVQIPTLEATPGGAEAEPFTTHHNALDRDFYLRISLELPLKRLLVAGYEKVFEIGRIFRNEGISTEHLQEFTTMEFYWAYGDFEKLMQMVQDMTQKVIQQTWGTLQLQNKGETIDWSGNWPKRDYFELFKKYTGLDLNTTDEAELKAYADKESINYEPIAKKGRVIDLIFKKKIRILPELFTQPCFLINQPIEIEPLAKKNPENPKMVQRFQIMAACTELGKGFGELNDPIDQRERFEAQMKLREAGDNEAQMLDEDYLEAMEYGMPPCAGFAYGDRLFSVLMDKSIRETVIFPLMHEEKKQEGKAKETKIAVAVVNKGAKLETWQEMNTIAHLNAEFGVHEGRKLLLQDEITTKDGKKIKLNPQHAIMIKTAGSSADLQKLSADAKKQGMEVSEFTREMLETTDDKKVIAAVKEKNLTDVEFLGVLVFGKKADVEKLTKHLELYS